MGLGHNSSVRDWLEPVPLKPAHQTVTYTALNIADVVPIQLILLMMGTVVLVTCKELEYIYTVFFDAGPTTGTVQLIPVEGTASIYVQL
jgi:hypothetical protein